MAKAHSRGGWLGDLAGAWIFYSVLPLPPGITPRFERIARFAPWVALVIGGLLSQTLTLILAPLQVLSGGVLIVGAWYDVII